MQLKTGISPNYVKGWDVKKAIRELVQNYLDSRSEFGVKGYTKWANGLATLKDDGPGLEMRHLALGVSEKSDAAKGQYGEGLKLAMLVLAREGRFCEVRTKGQIIRPAIVFDEAYGTKTLVLNVTDMTARVKARMKGTAITFQCTKDEFEAGKEYFVEFGRKTAFQWIDKDAISTPGGFIYVNGTRVGEIAGAQYSYHLNGKVEVGNRDREIVDMDKVRPYVARLIAETGSEEVMANLLFRAFAKRGGQDAEIGMGIDYARIPWKRKRTWHKIFNRLFGNNAVIASGTYGVDHYVEELGYKVLRSDNWQWETAAVHVGAKSAMDQIQKQAKRAPEIKMSELTEIERHNLKRAKMLIAKYYKPTGKVAVVAEIKDLDSNQRVTGYHSYKKDKTVIRRDMLANLKDTVEVLLHETVHKYSGAKDNTREFERALILVAVNMMVKE